MGWCSGSYIAEDIYNKVREYLPEEKRKEVATLIYDTFCDEDADCWEDNMNIIQDAQPDWLNEE